MSFRLPDNSRAWAEVDLAALRSNARALVAHFAPDAAIMAVLKADAYGHGIVQTAQTVVAEGIDWLGVATVSEGLALRNAGITASVALLCTPAPQEVREIVVCGLTPMVGTAELCAALSRAKGDADLSVHLDIDTGMGRSGVLAEHVCELYENCLRCGLTVTGISTHFADADGETPQMTNLQRRRFDQAKSALLRCGAQIDWIHAGNSAAALRIGAGGCNLMRPGLLLYGIRPILAPGDVGAKFEFGEDPAWPSDDRANELLERLKPVLSLKARIGAVRELPAGHTISYGATYRLNRPSRVATVLIGYGDGYPRALSNRGEVLLHGRRAPIIGRVCMDQMVIDVTDAQMPVAAGDECICIGAEGAESITSESIAQTIQTTEHEITTSLAVRLPRIYCDASSISS